MRTKCGVCVGRGRVAKSLPPGVYGFSEWPTEQCQNCKGEGWVGEAEVRHKLIPDDLGEGEGRR